MTYLRTTGFVTILGILAFGGCSSRPKNDEQPPQSTTTHEDPSQAEVVRTMEAYFQEGMKRGFGPGGPLFELPVSYYEFFGAHLQESAPFLDGKLAATNGPSEINAYDIIIHMARNPASRDWSLSRLKNAIAGGGPAAKYYVQPVYEQLAKQ